MGEGEGEERPSWTRVRRRPAVQRVELGEDDQERLDEDALLACAIGAAVLEQRLWLGWSQSRLAEEAGVDEGTISRLERGVYLQPALRTLRKIAWALTLEVSELLELAEEQLDAVAPISHRSPTAHETR